MSKRTHKAICRTASLRCTPNAIFLGGGVSCALSGKKQELPIKKLLLGQPIEKIINKEAMANPGCMDGYVAFAAGRAPGLSA